MTIIIYKREEVNGKMVATEFGRWKDGKMTNIYNDRIIEISRDEVIHRNNNGYYGTTEIDD